MDYFCRVSLNTKKIIEAGFPNSFHGFSCNRFASVARLLLFTYIEAQFALHNLPPPPPSLENENVTKIFAQCSFVQYNPCKK